VLVTGKPAFGALLTPALKVVSEGANLLQLDQ
jgi:hypothetical protein